MRDSPSNRVVADSLHSSAACRRRPSADVRCTRLAALSVKRLARPLRRIVWCCVFAGTFARCWSNWSLNLADETERQNSKLALFLFLLYTVLEAMPDSSESSAMCFCRCVFPEILRVVKDFVKDRIGSAAL